MNTEYLSSLREEESRFLEKMTMPFSRTWVPFCERWEAGQEEEDRAARNCSVGEEFNQEGDLRPATLTGTVPSSPDTLWDGSMLRLNTVSEASCACV